ncbi:MAG: alpha/beta hydrolase [Halobacteriales archaeon]|nr:alpha/beta hydrolase [Halobacteriales archaeon]
MSDSAWVSHLGGTVEHVEGDRFTTRMIAHGDGDEPPLVLLHGIGGHAETYVRNVVPLAEALGDRTVAAIDFVGHGYSSRPADLGYHIEDYMDQVEGFVDALGHDTAHVHGESLGGWVAGRLGLDRPELVETVGLITTSGVYHIDTSGAVEEDVKDESIEGIENLYETSMSMLDAGVTRETVADRLQWLFVEDVDEELVDVRHEIYSQEANQVAMRTIYESFLEDVKDPDRYFTTEELRGLEAPTLVIHTEHNPSAKKELAKYVHDQLPTSTYHLYEHSAHWPQWEEPERYHEDTLAFLDSYAG